MKGPLVVLATLAAAAPLTTVAAGGPDATKQRVAISIKFHESTFALFPFHAGTLEYHLGKLTDDAPNAPCRKVIRDGQNVEICKGGRWTLTSKLGILTIQTSAEWVNAGSGGCGVALGTWRVVRGTGGYAGITGGGRSAYDAHCKKWYARHEGFLIRS